MRRDADPVYRFGSSPRPAAPQETLLAGLARRGWPRLVRSIRYHRPRGPVCGTGDCAGCLVRVNDRPNVRACTYRPSPGDRVVTENSWPSPSLDLFGALDLLLPHGIDTLRGLRRPARAVPFYQRVVRRLAGFGRAPPASLRLPPASGERRRAPVVVVGAGRSGRAVAAGLVAEGLSPLLLERSERVAPVDGATLVEGVTAVFLPPPSDPGAGLELLAVGEGGRGLALSAPRVVVASGSYDGPLLFEGSDRPGVVTADLLLRVPELPVADAVVVGGGPRVLPVLDRIGPRVHAIVAPGEIRPEVVARASEQGIPLYPRSRLVRAVGRRRVRRIELAARGDGSRFALRCDTVVLAHRRLPNAQLAFQAGAARTWRGEPGGYYPEVLGDGRTTVPGLWVVGSAARPGAPAAYDPKALAADVAHGDVAGRAPSTGSAPPEPGLYGYYKELLSERRRGKWVVCPCEDVLLEEVEEAVRRGFRGLEVVKRYTGVGTGLCQGRFCLPEALWVLSVLEARAPAEVGSITQRPPLAPTALNALAGLASFFDEEEVP